MEELKSTSTQFVEVSPLDMAKQRPTSSKLADTTLKEPNPTSDAHADTTLLESEEPKSTSDAVADAIPIPTLEDAPLKSHLKSHFIILVLVTSGILAAYTYGFELLQAEHATWTEMAISLTLLVGFGGGVFWSIGAHKIDWWELVLGYWWFSMPAAGGAGLLLVRLMEGSEELAEKS